MALKELALLRPMVRGSYSTSTVVHGNAVRFCARRRPRIFDGRWLSMRWLVFKSVDEMVELFSDLPEALENSVEIAKRCSLSITLGKNYLPNFPTPPGMTIDEFLCQLAASGLEKRLAQLYPDEKER